MDQELKAEMEEARGRMELLMSLLKSPSWDLVVKIFIAQVQSRLNELGNRPLIGMEDALERNYKLGMAHGLQLAARMPTDMYNEIHRVYTDKLEELRNESTPA